MPRRTIVKFGLLILLLGTGIYLFTWGPLHPYASPQHIRALLQSIKDEWWLKPLFVLGYAVGGLVAFPGSVATLVGGAVFGVWWGSLLNWVGANGNALLGFLISRYLGRGLALKLTRGRLAKFDAAVCHHGFRAVLLMRLIPALPFNVMNIGAGLSPIRLRDYLLATALGITPGCIIYTYFADALVEGSMAARKESAVHLAISSGLLLLLAVIPLWIRKQRPAK